MVCIFAKCNLMSQFDSSLCMVQVFAKCGSSLRKEVMKVILFYQRGVSRKGGDRGRNVPDDIRFAIRREEAEKKEGIL